MKALRRSARPVIASWTTRGMRSGVGMERTARARGLWSASRLPRCHGLFPALRARAILPSVHTGIKKGVAVAGSSSSGGGGMAPWRVQGRTLSTAAGEAVEKEEEQQEEARQGEEEGKEQEVLIYEGIFSKSVRRVKMFSVTSCVLTCIGAPVLVAFGNPELSILHRSAVGVLVMSFGLFTTAFLNWAMKPYVINMWYRPTSNPKTLRMETTTLFAKPKFRVVNLLDLDPETYRPMSSFKDSSSGTHFFVHAELLASQLSLKPVLRHVILFPGDDEEVADPTEKPGEADVDRVEEVEKEAGVAQGTTRKAD